ncbi:hypothetical protein [Actinoplanes sp. NPDC051494]|uniref:hypothetical protein n=1 Tax=Actinoplanes sp. NPDC051494 TaxID=3363907 RepID=UPI0037A8E5E8
MAGKSRAGAVPIALGILVLVLIAGFGLHLLNRSDAEAAPEPSTPPPRESTDWRDTIAAEPMLQLPAAAARPQPLVARTAGTPLRIPASRKGSDPVPTGFPRTAEGALGQLAAIDEAAMSTADPGLVHEVYETVAASGAVPEAEWTPSVAVQRLTKSLGEQKGTAARVTFRVVQGQIKGTVGDDFVLACVLGEYSVALSTGASVGLGDCQRMVWDGGRWLIGPGAQPAWAPSAWPGSADAVRAGWKELRRAAA